MNSLRLILLDGSLVEGVQPVRQAVFLTLQLTFKHII